MQNLIQTDTIKNNIKRNLQVRGWSAADLERKIGNTRNISNILRGTSKYPTIEVLQRIAKAFNIEVTQLLWENNNSYEPINHTLLTEAFIKTLNFVKPLEEQFNIIPENIFSLVEEVYNYSQKLNVEFIEDKFIEWVVSKYYKLL